MTDSALTDLSHAALAAIVNYWPALPDPDFPALRALPKRQYVTIGSPRSDCEQLVVFVERTFGTEGNPARESIVDVGSGTPWLRTMVCGVQILRCIEVVDAQDGQPVFPEAATIDGEGSAILTDADVVLQCLIASYKAGQLGRCGAIALENWRATSEEGGLAGGVTRVRLNLF